MLKKICVLFLAGFLVAQGAFAVKDVNKNVNEAAVVCTALDNEPDTCIPDDGRIGYDPALEDDIYYNEPVYMDPYLVCQRELTPEELEKEKRLQSEIDVLQRQIEDLYKKMDEKMSQLSSRYDEDCIKEVEKNNTMETCNLSGDEYAKMDALRMELDALYQKLGGENDEQVWEQIKVLEGQLSTVFTCGYYGPYGIPVAYAGGVFLDVPADEAAYKNLN